MNRLFVFLLLVFVVSACSVRGQKSAINDARIGVASGAVALKATDEIVAGYYADKPAEDEESYCRNKIASIILTQIKISLETAADAILVWEESLAAYLAKKEAKQEIEIDWQEVLSSESSWFKILASVLGALDGLRKSLKLWSIELPYALDYAWDFLSGLSGKEVQGDFEFDFKDLKESICINHLPGSE